jgi:uncharacterized iron-regulated membrane protein
MFGVSTRVILYLVGGLALAGTLGAGYVAWRHHERMIGYQAALADVARQDAHAKAIADQAMRDISECEAGGGSFDVSTGNCS